MKYIGRALELLMETLVIAMLFLLGGSAIAVLLVVGLLELVAWIYVNIMTEAFYFMLTLVLLSSFVAALRSMLRKYEADILS